MVGHGLRGRPESLRERLWRFRSILLLVSIPVALFALVLLFMPSSLAPLPTGERRYAVVVDAGSTGSRVHAFAFSASRNGGLELLSDTFEQLKPGLSSFAETPAEGAASLRPLLEKALAAIPASAHSSTPVEVRATAGLRLLPGDKAEQLLSAVRELLHAYPFEFNQGSVSILDGAQEGAFQWLTLNYLLGNLEKGVAGTVAAIDLGGGSVQLAHALSSTVASRAPDGYVSELRGGGRKYSVYVHSYLGYGLMAARAALLKLEGSDAASSGHPCLADAVSYTYAGATVSAASGGKAASAASCLTAAVGSLNADKSCAPAPAGECGFNGAWGGGGGVGAAKFYVSSYFWDRAQQAGLVPEGALQVKLTPSAYLDAAQTACAAPSGGLGDSFPGVPAGADAQLFCLDVTYCHALLTSGFGLEEEQEVTLVKQVEYRGEGVEAAWPLGAAINSLGSD